MAKYKLDPKFSYKIGLLGVDNKFYDLHNLDLPDNLTYDGNLVLYKLELKKLPKKSDCQR